MVTNKMFAFGEAIVPHDGDLLWFESEWANDSYCLVDYYAVWEERDWMKSSWISWSWVELCQHGGLEKLSEDRTFYCQPWQRNWKSYGGVNGQHSVALQGQVFECGSHSWLLNTSLLNQTGTHLSVFPPSWSLNYTCTPYLGTGRRSKNLAAKCALT